MGKKKVAIVTGISILIIILAVGGYFLWRHYRSNGDTKVLNESTVINPEQSSNKTNDTGLSITPAQNLTNLGQLGNTGTSSGGGSSSIRSTSFENPTPEVLKGYEQYKDATNALFGDLVKGTGAEVKASSKVAIYYKGWLTDGTLFDQTRQDESGKLQPFMFTVGANEVIPGMEQGIFGMKVGGTRRIIIPSALGYGAQGQGPVPANSMLIFDVQLIAVQ